MTGNICRYRSETFLSQIRDVRYRGAAYLLLPNPVALFKFKTCVKVIGIAEILGETGPWVSVPVKTEPTSRHD